DEPDGIGDHDRRSTGQPDTPHRRVESREELIRNVGVGARHGAKQRRLARIGIADQRDARHGNLLAHAPPRLALLLDAAEAAREYAYPLAEEPPVGLELRLAG